jgi:hypothetical protein
MKNVADSDGTIAFRINDSGTGTDKTIGYCQTGIWKKGKDIVLLITHIISGQLVTMDKETTKNKAVCIIADVDDEENAANSIIDFIHNNKLHIINVCGHRQSGVTKLDFQARVKSIMKIVLSCL